MARRTLARFDVQLHPNPNPTTRLRLLAQNLLAHNAGHNQLWIGCLPVLQQQERCPHHGRRRGRRLAPAVSINTGALRLERPGLGLGRVLLFDIQGWITLILGGLLALITLFSSYSHVHVPFSGTVTLDQQIGVLLLIALVPALFGDAELATRRRLRAERDRVQEAEDRARAEDEAAEERERAARRARRQDRCALAQFEFQLNPNAATRQRLADLISLLREYGEFA